MSKLSRAQADQQNNRTSDGKYAEKAGSDPGEVNLTAGIDVDGLIEALDRLPEQEQIEFFRRIADNPKLWEGMYLAGHYGPGFNTGNTEGHLDSVLEDYPNLELSDEERAELVLAVSREMASFEPDDSFYNDIGEEIDAALVAEIENRFPDRL